MTQQLSLAARSVFESFNSKLDWVEDGVPGPQFKAIAAALRAAADKIPYLPKTPSEYDINVQDGREEVREKFLAIADELEAQ